MKLQYVSYLACCLGLTVSITTALGQVTTSQYDNMRSGATLNEKTLTPQNVNPKQFGKLGAFKVDGAVYAQPLFVPSVEIPGKGKHDVLFVATEHAIRTIRHIDLSELSHLGVHRRLTGRNGGSP